MPNLAARQLKGQSSGLIGLLSVPSYLGLVALLQAEIITCLQSQGMEVLTVHINSYTDHQKVLQNFRSRNVNGIIALNMKSKLIQSESDAIPLVYCSHTNLCGFDVGCDIQLAGYLAAKHLIGHGRTNLVYLGLDTGPYNPIKFRGMCQALEESGLDASKDRLLIVEDGNLTEILQKLKRHRADALICCNDFTAADMLKALIQNGIKVPDDIAMTGIDGYAFCKYTPVTLATVAQPINELSQCASEMLMRRIKEKIISEQFSNIKIPPVFIPGESCGCPEAPCVKISGNAFIHL
ncbi:MAG: LacI family DNA-binding transcriptional regulator [Kiritimatiellia bacterium]